MVRALLAASACRVAAHLATRRVMLFARFSHGYARAVGCARWHGAQARRADRTAERTEARSTDLDKQIDSLAQRIKEREPFLKEAQRQGDSWKAGNLGVAQARDKGWGTHVTPTGRSMAPFAAAEFFYIKAAANSSMPVPPIGTNRDRVGMVTGSGNPNVLEEAAAAKPYGRAKDGPAWREGLRNGTQPMDLPGNSNRRNMRSRRSVTY